MGATDKVTTVNLTREADELLTLVSLATHMSKQQILSSMVVLLKWVNPIYYEDINHIMDFLLNPRGIFEVDFILLDLEITGTDKLRKTGVALNKHIIIKGGDK